MSGVLVKPVEAIAMKALRTVAPAGLRTVSVPPWVTAAIDRESLPRSLIARCSPPPAVSAAEAFGSVPGPVGAAAPGEAVATTQARAASIASQARAVELCESTARR